MSQVAEDLKEKVHRLVSERKWIDLRKITSEMYAPEVAELLMDLDSTDRVLFFRSLSRELSNEAFSYLDAEDQNALMLALGDRASRKILASLSPDDRTHLFEELPGQATQRLLNLLSPEDLAETRQLLGYPEDSVGRLMTPDYLAVRPDWTIERALSHIRTKGQEVETLNVIYVVDSDWKLLDALGLKKFVMASPSDTVRSIMDDQFVCLSAFDDRQVAVDTMRKYDLSVLPVVDSSGVLVGIVTFDDVLDVAEKEATEDIQLLGGLAPVEIDYSKAGVILLWKKRVLWLIVLLVLQVLASSVIQFYAYAIDTVVALAFFIPALIGSGGNTGTQSATLVIRGIATQEIDIAKWKRIFFKELQVGVLLGLTLGLAAFARGLLMGGGDRIALVVGFTMIAIIIWSNVIGALLPIFLAKIRLDPALVSSPLITTTVDVTGLLIYFNIAKVVLGI